MPATPAFIPDYSAILPLPATPRLDVLADELELMLHGGQATDDSPYDWRFLRVCVQQAFDVETGEKETLNAAVLQADYLTRKKDEQESYFNELKAKTEFWETPERWVQAWAAPLLYDADRGEEYFLLPPVFVALRRYQNLPGENAVRELRPTGASQRGRYRFAYLPSGASAFRRLPGGLLGRWGYYTEQLGGAAVDVAHRVYLVPPCAGARFPAKVPLTALYVVRDDRTSALPPPPLRLVEDYDIVRRALELALLRTKEDRVQDANPMPTQPQN